MEETNIINTETNEITVDSVQLSPPPKSKHKLKIKKFIPIIVILIILISIIFVKNNIENYSGYEGAIKKSVELLEKGKYYKLFQMASNTSFFPSDTLPEDFSKNEAIEYITEDIYSNIIGDIESGMKLDYEILSVEEYSKEDIRKILDNFVRGGAPISIINDLNIDEMYYVTYLIKCEEADTYYTASDIIFKENGEWKIRMS